MMFNQKLAAAIKVNGKVLREFKDTVYVKFGSEYSILIKNLETRRVIVNVFIDGDNVVPGGLVLNAGQEIDLERSIRNGNLSEGNRFKFIERTGRIEQHRGVKLEDGLVRIEYQFEHVYDYSWKTTTGMRHPWQDDFNTWPKRTSYPWNETPLSGVTGDDIKYKGVLRNSGVASSTLNAVNMATTQSFGDVSSTYADTSRSFTQQSLNDAGITVAGGKSEQKFSTASWFPTESQRHVMIFRLLGETADNQPVTESVTVKAKQKCDTCGRNNKATAKFCTECGTALTIYA